VGREDKGVPEIKSNQTNPTSVLVKNKSQQEKKATNKSKHPAMKTNRTRRS
jgi:hypothetical protein